MRLIFVVGLWLVGFSLVLGVLGFGMSLESSTFTPDPGAPVSLFVCGAPAGATFRWDLDGDGIYDRTTTEPQVTFSASPGMRLVKVEVVSAGRTIGQLIVAIVADSKLGATRSVIREETSYLVTISVTSKTPLIAPGFVEDIPAGFAVEVVAEGGAFWRKAEKLEVVWPVILDPGQTLTFSYRFYPLAGVDFQFSGLVSGYVEGKRVEVPIAGIIKP